MARYAPARQSNNRIYDGRVERTSKTRKFVAPKRPSLDECKVTYTDEGVRTVKPPRVRPKKHYFQGKRYYINPNIVGA